MNNNTKLGIWLIAIVVGTLLLITCNQANANLELPPSNSRIKIVTDFYPYQIIEVDGVEYLSRSQGGIIKLEN